jgi:altronate hydrolase
MDEQRPPDMIVLHDTDNVATALRDLPAGSPVRVAGTHGPLPELTPKTAIRLGHKAAIRGIPAGKLVVKHGYPIGRATADIALGAHVHVHNVLSLSRETDVADVPAGEGD